VWKQEEKPMDDQIKKSIIRSLDRKDHDPINDAFDEEFIGLTLLANALSGKISFVQLGAYYRGRPGFEAPWDIVHDVFDKVFALSHEELDRKLRAIIGAHERFAAARSKGRGRAGAGTRYPVRPECG